MRYQFAVLMVGLSLVLPACVQPPPDPVPPCQPVPDAPSVAEWRTATQLALTWTDMPVTVGGGDEACVLQRRAMFDLAKALSDKVRAEVYAEALATPSGMMKVKQISSFHGFDKGDSIESTTILYAKDGQRMYARSEHLEEVDENYDAFDDPVPYSYETDGLILDAICRVTGNNAEHGRLDARCHFEIMVEFEADTPSPPEECEVPHAEDPGWSYLATSTESPKLEPGQPTRVFQTKALVAAAKVAIDPANYSHWTETLAALAAHINAQDCGGKQCCAAGPWDDELVALASDGVYEGYKVVTSFNTYQGQPERDAWVYGAAPPSECGLPDPFGLPAEYVLKKHNQYWDRTYRVKDYPYCQEACASFAGRSKCPVRCEGDPEREPCEERVEGDAKWFCDGVQITGYCGTVGAPCLSPTNPAQAKCKSHVKTCTEDGATCAEGDW